jgi:hypothetical protein
MREDEKYIAGFISVLIISIATVISISVIQIQKTNREFIRNGYSQIQMIGRSMTSWIKK